MKKFFESDLFNYSFCIIVSLACGIIANILMLSIFDAEIYDFFPWKELDKAERFAFIAAVIAAIVPTFLGVQIAEDIVFWYDYWKLIIFVPIVAALVAFIALILIVVVAAFVYEGPAIIMLTVLICGAISAPTVCVIRIFWD